MRTLVVVSTSDVKGKTGPCGCHIPKGGLSRRASMVDSLRLTYGQVLLVAAGGFVPEEAERESATGFIMSVMKTLGTDAANVGEGDLRFGRAFLLARAARSGLPLVSANLLDKATQKPLFNPYLLRKVGNVNVGIFGLIGSKANLGLAQDSLSIADPQATAQATIAQLRQKGAQVVVLLSQLGKIDSEAVIVGRNVPLLERGRMLKNTIACYGGDQGHYVCRTELTLNASGHPTSAQAEAVILGPEVSDRPAIDASVRAFEATLTAVAPGATPAPGTGVVLPAPQLPEGPQTPPNPKDAEKVETSK